MIGFLKKIFGTKHEKEISRLRPIVDEINEEFAKLSTLSDDELRGKTTEFQALIRERISAQQSEIEELQDRLRKEQLSHADRMDVYARIDVLEKEEIAIIDDTLNEILPLAFAVAKEACRRLVGKTFNVVGQPMTWDMVPYDVQLLGGMVLHEGKISEMATGEGKTLVAVAPIYLNALAGRGVHLVTVNDYLARRDSEWMGNVYKFLGLSIGCIQSNMDPEERKIQYNSDITYGTNNEFGFDYLRDNMVGNEEDMVQRPHFYAIVDEVDSVLVDEARTPLIISGPVHHTDQRYEEMNPAVRALVEEQKRFVAKLVSDAETLLKSTKKEEKREAGIALLRSFRGFPKNKRLQKILQEPDNTKIMREVELEFLADQGTKMSEIDEELYYAVDERNHTIDLTEKGRTYLAKSKSDKDFFVIPDIATELSMLAGETGISEEERQLRKDFTMRLYAERTDRIHTVTQLLRAYSLYEKDVEYVVDDGKVKIVDEFTGRILDGRRYSDGLHQAIEAKENVFVEKDTQTLATITLQNYFRLYKKLAGMTGTAETEAAEFEEIYGLDVVVIPTNRKIARNDMDDMIYRTRREKYNAVIEEVQKQVALNRAVLVGTTSVEVSELLSKMLTRLKIKHNVLNAKQHQREAEIVATAGRPATVTIATNMAGRGTDIKLDPIVREAGGLCIIGTERHEARRIDRQLRGRAGRQGDPGSSQFFISLEDELMRLFGGERIAGVMQRLNIEEGEAITAGIVTKSVENAQKKVEENNFAIRKRLLEYDNVMNQQREVIYDRRRHALKGERLRGEIFEYVVEMAGEWYDSTHETSNVDEFREHLRTTLLCDVELTQEEFAKMSRDEVIDKVEAAAEETYSRKEELLGADFMGQLERVAVLQTIDEKWREHLRTMDELKEGIHLRAYGQKDPLLEYKGEAYKLFVELIREINKESVEFAFKYYPEMIQQQVPSSQERAPEQRMVQQQAQPQRRQVQQQRPQPQQQSGGSVSASASHGMMAFSNPSVSYYPQNSRVPREIMDGVTRHIQAAQEKDARDESSNKNG